MNLLRRRYVGKVSASSRVEDGSGNTVFMKGGAWVLTDGPIIGRRGKLIGDPGNSFTANGVKASVAAWIKGGPLPQIDIDASKSKSATVLRLVRQKNE
jgi:hypothetical protein